MRFSQRMGLSPATKLAQRDSMDDDLRASLWNALSHFYWDEYEDPDRSGYGLGDPPAVRGSNLERLILSIWIHYFKRPTDTIPPSWKECLSRLRSYFFNTAGWADVYDFVEFIADEQSDDKHKRDFVKACNNFLERENSAYRFVDGKIAEITSSEEVSEVENAIENSLPFAGVKTHLESALALMADRRNPDYRNSVKESISAVESLAKKLTGNDKAKLSDALVVLEKSKRLHPALKNAFSALYGYTSDAEGIRHALLEESTLTKIDARFMLVCCSAFVNYSLDTVKEA